MLEVLHSASARERAPDTITAVACVNSAYGFVHTGIGCGIVLQVETLANIPLQAVFPAPGELFEIRGFNNNQSSSLVAQKGLFVVAEHFGAESDILGFVVEIEFFDKLSVLAIDKLGG